MPVDPRFAESWINDRHTVLGFELRPFCLYYRLLFEVTESPFLTGAPFSIVELSAAVRMCRMDFGDWIRTKPLSFIDKWRLSRLSNRFDLGTEANKLEAYLCDHFSPPEFWHKAQGSSHGLPPETASLAAQLINATGWTEERVWMLPIGKAYWYSALFAKIGGAELRFVSETEDELEAVRKAKAEYQAEKARRLGAKLKAEE